MALSQNQELEYMVDEYYDTTDFDDSTFGDDESPRSTDPDVSADSDFEDDFEVVLGKFNFFDMLLVLSSSFV